MGYGMQNEDIRSEDIRSVKTERALFAAMFSMLKKSSFRKITIKGICEEASLSRAAFYAHFIDKYDLLKRWIAELWPKDITNNDSYEKIEQIFNYYISDNVLIIKNLLIEADDETIDILFFFLLSTINIKVDKHVTGDIDAKNVVLSNFYAGGTISYMLWQVKNRFPPAVPPVNIHFYEMIRNLQDWHQK